MLDIITKASEQWASRPADERFTSLHDMRDEMQRVRDNSLAKVLPNRRLEAQPAGDPEHKGLVVIGPNGGAVTPTHWSFGQLASLAGAPAGYLRTLPSPMAADCLNYGLHVNRDVEEVGTLLTLREDGTKELRAATGPNYGRVWNVDIVNALIRRFGDGVSGDWRVPGEFGKDVAVDKNNTTLYASDRDMFVFLADEHNKVEIPNRRNGQPGALSRGFFVWNSEVGSQTLGIAMFLFDYVCCNRIVWGATQYQERKFRHTSGAPHRWIEEIRPMLTAYANSAAGPIEAKLQAAQAHKLSKVDEFLAKRFTVPQAKAFQAVHVAEEHRPIETVWDAVTAATAYARNIEHQDKRVALEREAGKLLDLVAA